MALPLKEQRDQLVVAQLAEDLARIGYSRMLAAAVWRLMQRGYSFTQAAERAAQSPEARF